MRDLTKPEIQAKFDNHNKLHQFEVDKLFGIKDDKKLSKEQYRWLCKGFRNFFIFDIEALHFDARIGFMICWYGVRWDILTDECKVIYDHLEKKDMKEQYKKYWYDFDYYILQTLSRELKKSDVVVGHYIKKFDLPYFSKRAHITGQHNIDIEYNDFRIIDTWEVTKKKLNMYQSGGNSLRNAGYVLTGKDDKTSVDLDHWKGIYYADRPDWKKNRQYICDHCEIDIWQNFDVFMEEIKKVPVGGTIA